MIQVATKIIFFAVFVSLLYFSIDFILDYFKHLLAGVSILTNISYFFCYFGVYNALNLLISFLIGNWLVNKILKYISF